MAKTSIKSRVLPSQLQGRCGRPKALSQRELELMQALYFNEGLSVRKVADALRVSHMTVWRALCELPVPMEGTQ